MTMRIRSNAQKASCCPPERSVQRLRYVPDHYKVRAGVLKALAHPARLFIADCLEQRDHNVGELVGHIGLDQSTVSKHLGVLRAAGIVDDEKRGRETWYHLKLPCVTNFFSCIEDVLAQSAAGRPRGGAG